MRNKSIEILALAAFCQLKMLFGCSKENFDIPTPTVDTNYFIVW